MTPLDRQNVSVVMGAVTELTVCGVIAEVMIRAPELRLTMVGVLSAVIMAGVNGRSRRGTGLGSDPPPPMPGGGGGSKPEQVIIMTRAPSPDRTGFTDNPPNSSQFKTVSALRGRRYLRYGQWRAILRIPRRACNAWPAISPTAGGPARKGILLFAVFAFLLLFLSSCAPLATAAPPPPTPANIEFGLAIDKCERDAKTRSQYEECRADLIRIYGVDGGARDSG